MAVYTEVPFADAAALLHKLDLGDLTELRGIEGGIENTNYFVTSEKGGATHEHVLTVFERLSFEQLPYYLHLMKHLAGQGIPVPEPATDAQGEVLHRLLDKPAAVVDKLSGKSVLAPAECHCEAVGEMLARMHLAGRDYPLSQPNLRGLPWWNETAPVVLPKLEAAQATLLRSELAYQNHVASLPAYTALPRGPVHADLFRDNAMFDGDQLTGFFDFYFAGNDSFLFDLAVCLNDWCVRHGDPEVDGQHDPSLARAMVQAYQRTRPLSPAERQLLPAMLRAAALRFWLSRLWDWYLPRDAAMLQPHDPAHFERVLLQRLHQASHLTCAMLDELAETA